ncbi:MAG: baseplate J/gp47 family protein [Ruminococcaceae bacterium]|nr:baseplate J/gp47 family protein [Oscillospiraceae bacterium]
MSKNYPDITFVEADTQTITNEIISAYERKTGRTLYPADPARIQLLFLSSIVAQERVLMNEAARQNMPRFAKGSYLDSLCEIFFDVQRLGAIAATTQLEFTISELQSTAIVIPAGTRATVDGQIMYATLTDTVIPPGELTVTAEAQCIVSGTVGNGFSAGQVNVCVDLFPYFSAVTNITETGGGSNVETDEELYERMRQSVESYSTAGPVGSYIYHAKSASALVADVTASSPTPGVVDIRVLCEGGEFPDEELIAKIQSALSDDKVRPLTDNVVVQAPEVVGYDVALTFYVGSDSGMSLAAADEAVYSAVSQFTAWQSQKLGRDINPSYLIQLVMQTGVKRVELTAPERIVLSNVQAAQLGTISIVNGGYEDE